ncbi:MAG: carbon-nitrogen hydrolase family protein [Ruminococcaceae bacterium]|nr:carbon-nitrogen hydrolase family protein [Oscillospiraceae bacterium]
MKIAVIQQYAPVTYNRFNELPDIDELLRRKEASVNRCLELIEEAAKAGAELCVTIETVNAYLALGDTRFKYTDTLECDTVRRFSEAARLYKTHIVAGLALSFDGVPYNCAVLFDDTGAVVGIHKKVHLPAGEELHYAHGDKFEVFNTKFGKIGMLVCWDMQFPEAARELALADADLIACPTYGWENIYGLSRAYENSVYIATGMCTYRHGLWAENDPSCIVDNMGKILASCERDSEGIAIADVDIKKEPLPQYGSQNYYPSHSMRKTRFSQRRPEAYQLINKSNEELPLYKRYFANQKN